MAGDFGYEKLTVYQKGLHFVRFRESLLQNVCGRIAACDHLERASESILINIAHASSSWSPEERIVYLGHANGSALECAGSLDVLVARRRLDGDDVSPAKGELHEVVSMLIAMKATAEKGRIREPSTPYLEGTPVLFSHEKLQVYERELQFVRWLDDILQTASGSRDVCAKLDRSSTAIVLNTVEGNGRFSARDQVKFLRTAYRSTVQSSALLDLVLVGQLSEREGY